MPDMHITQYEPKAGVAVAQLHIRDDAPAEDAGRTLEGLACPANERAQVGPRQWERIEPHAFDGSTNVTLTAMHGGAPLGTVEHWPTPEGVMVRAKVSHTTAGDDALTLLRDGVFTGLSVGFYDEVNGLDPDGTIVRKSGRLVECSLVPSPAYASAKVLSLRQSEGNIDMPEFEDIKSDLAALTTQTQDLARTVASHLVAPAVDQVAIRYRSAGEWIKGLVAGEDEAAELLTRDFTGTTTAAVPARPTWVTDAIYLVQQNRVSLEAFQTAALPATGMSVDYLKLGTDDTHFEEQVQQGDDLVYSKIDLTTASAPVKTYGSWTSMSIQSVQRSPVSVVDLAYQAMSQQAAKRTDLVFIAALVAAATASPSVTLGGATAGDWNAAVIEAQVQLATRGIGQPAEFILTDLTTLGGWANLSGPPSTPFLVPQGTVQTSSGIASGSVDTGGYFGVRGSILGLPVLVDPNLAPGSVFVCNSSALVTYGSPVPIRLTADADLSAIKTLTTAFSVYLMQAIATPSPSSVVRISV